MSLKVNRLIMLVVLFPFIPIMLINSTSYASTILVIKIVIGFACIPAVIFVKKEHIWLVSLLLLYCLSFLLPIILYGTLDLRSFVLNMYPFGFFVFLVVMIDRYPQDFIITLYNISFSVICLYLIYFTYYLFTNQLSTPILYENRNAIQTYMTFVIGSVLLTSNYLKDNKFSILDVFLLTISFFGMLLSTSSTAIFSAIVGISLIFFYKGVSFKIPLIVYSLFFIVVTIVGNTNNALISGVLKLLSKSSTFTNRDWRWEFSAEIFKQSPLFGNVAVEEKASHYLIWRIEYFNPHNALWYILVYAGIFGFIIILVLILLSIKNILKNRNLKQFYIVVLSMILCTGLMESNMFIYSFVFNIFLISAIMLKKEREN